MAVTSYSPLSYSTTQASVQTDRLPARIDNNAGTRLKVLIHDGLGIWLCTRALDDSKFHGLGERLMRHHSPPNPTTGLTISHEQFNALIRGLPWHNLGKDILTPLT